MGNAGHRHPSRSRPPALVNGPFPLLQSQAPFAALCKGHVPEGGGQNRQFCRQGGGKRGRRGGKPAHPRGSGPFSCLVCEPHARTQGRKDGLYLGAQGSQVGPSGRHEPFRHEGAVRTRRKRPCGGKSGNVRKAPARAKGERGARHLRKARELGNAHGYPGTSVA